MIKTKQKVLIAFLFVIFLTVVYAGSFFARDVKVFYNGNEIKYNVPTRIVSDYAMVPLSETLEAIYGRGTVYDPASKTSAFHVNGHVYTHTIGSNILYIDGAAKEYEMPPTLIDNDRALVSTKMIADITGCNIQWDPVNYHILITKPQPAVTPIPIAQVQATPVPTYSAPATIITADLNKSAITRGESVTVTVKTNKSANYVWVSDGTQTTPAIFAWEGADGIKTWVLSYKATKETNLSVSANTVQQLPGTSTKNLSLAVSSPTPAPTATPAANATIYSAVPNRTYIESGGSVSFTIRTNSAANYVWVDYNGGTSWATYHSMDVSGVKTWTATISPRYSQQISIRAGATQSSGISSYSTQYINVGGGYYSAITGGPYASPDTISYGGSTTITVNTNSETSYVWADLGDGRSYVYFNYSYDYYGGKVWTASVTMYSSRSIYVYAGSSMGSSNASASVYVTVQGQYQDYYSANYSPNVLYVSSGSTQNVYFTVTTDLEVTYVGATQDGSNYSTGMSTVSGNYRVWDIYVPVQCSGLNPYETVTVVYDSPYYGRRTQTYSVQVQP